MKLIIFCKWGVVHAGSLAHKVDVTAVEEHMAALLATLPCATDMHSSSSAEILQSLFKTQAAKALV